MGAVAVIRADRITKHYGVFSAAENVTFVIQRGEVIGFVGANGAGKTTTISMILGFIAPSSGMVQLFGESVIPQNAHVSHKNIGYAAGDMELPSQLTGQQYLDFLESQGDTVDAQWRAQLYDRFTPQLNKKIHTLSRGNKQKIALVAAFLHDPELAILDEPTSGLDPTMQQAFLDLVRECRERGKTIFMSSHYLNEVMEVCSRVILMRDGRIVQDVQTAELLSQGGKHITVKTGSKMTKPPKGAESIAQSYSDGVTVLTFVYKGDISILQQWLAGVKHLQDVEINDYNLEESFHSLYVARNVS